jgi:hypothetical protein
MSDESFFREVNQEVRQEQARQLWTRFGTAAIVIAVAVVAVTAGIVGYRHWQQTQADASGDRFNQALTLAGTGQPDQALEALRAIEQDGHGAYPVLARLRAASVLAAKGDAAGAVAGFDAVAADGSAPQAIRDMARLRAGYLLVDTGSYQDVSSRVEVLADDSNTLRHAAREALGLAAWKEGRGADALRFFDQITADDAAPRNTRDRATLLTDLIRGSGAAS